MIFGKQNKKANVSGASASRVIAKSTTHSIRLGRANLRQKTKKKIKMYTVTITITTFLEKNHLAFFLMTSLILSGRGSLADSEIITTTTMITPQEEEQQQ